jgi:hypothetical protein
LNGHLLQQEISKQAEMYGEQVVLRLQAVEFVEFFFSGRTSATGRVKARASAFGNSAAVGRSSGATRGTPKLK